MLARAFRPPRRVVVDLARLLPPPQARDRRGASELPLIVRAQGLVLGVVPAQQHAWLRARTGQWLAVVTCTLPTPVGDLPCQTLVPASAVGLAETDGSSASEQATRGSS